MKILALDTEHASGIYRPWEEGYYLSCVGLVKLGDWSDKEVIWFNHKTAIPDPNGMDRVQKLIDEADIVVAHNMKHDMNILRYYGVKFNGRKIWCTKVAEYLLSGQDKERSYSLKAVAPARGLKPKLDKVAEMWANGIETYNIPEELLYEYVLDDAEKCGLIYMDQYNDMLGENMTKLIKLQMELMIVLSDMEINGFVWDNDAADVIVAEYTERIAAIDKELLDIINEPRLNLNSPEQLSTALFGGTTKLKWKEWFIHEYKTKPYSRYYEREFSAEFTHPGLGFVPEKGTESASKKGIFSTDKGVIQRLKCNSTEQRRVKKLLLQRSADAQVIKMIRGSKGDKGLMSKVQSDGLIHPNLNQTIAATGRLTSSDPNGQNLPRSGTSPIKQCIVPRFDGIGQFDLSQIEWRTAGWLSRDETMILEINNGVDQHVEACVHLMELTFIDKKDPQSKENRNYAKTFNFRMIYGGTAYGFYMDHRMPNFSKKKWERIVRDFFKKYYGLEAWHIKSIKWVTEGNTLSTPSGRKFALHKYQDNKGDLIWNERQIKNYPVQSLAGDILYLFAVILRRGMVKAGLKSKLILTVHDSIVFDYLNEELDTLMKLCFKIMDQLPQYITNYFKLDQPWDVDLEGEFEIGPNYGDMKEVKLD